MQCVLAKFIQKILTYDQKDNHLQVASNIMEGCDIDPEFMKTS